MRLCNRSSLAFELVVTTQISYRIGRDPFSGMESTESNSRHELARAIVESPRSVRRPRGDPNGRSYLHFCPQFNVTKEL